MKRVRVGQSTVRDSTGEGFIRGTTQNFHQPQAAGSVSGRGWVFHMWEHFEQGDGLFSKDGLHLNKRGAAVLGKGFLRALGDGIQLSLN